MQDTDILSRVHQAAACRILFLPHAVRQMARPERMITTSQVRATVTSGEVIEDYPEDPRGHSCLMLGGEPGGRQLHVVCSPKPDYLAIITTYLPSPEKWEGDLKTRKSP